MNRALFLADFLASEQAERVDLDRCRLVERPDGTAVVTVVDGGVTLVGPVVDLDAGDFWPFEDGTQFVVLVAGGNHPARDIREVLNSPQLTPEVIDELVRDPNFKLVVDLTQAKLVAVEGVDRLVADIGAVLVMLAEGDANASHLLAELRDLGSAS
jgi:hypothetical protein